MFFIQNRYPDNFFYIFLSLFSLSPLRTAEITTPRHSFTTFTTAYPASIYPTPALRLVTWSTTESGTTRKTIRLSYYASRYPHINIATAPPEKDGRRHIPVRQSSCPTTSKAAPPSHSPTNFQSYQYPQPQNGVCRRIRHPRAKIFAIDAAVTFDGRYMKQYQFDRCDKTAWQGMKDMKILK